MLLAGRLIVYAAFVGLAATARAMFERRWHLAMKLALGTLVAAVVGGSLIGVDCVLDVGARYGFADIPTAQAPQILSEIWRRCLPASLLQLASAVLLVITSRLHRRSTRLALP
jgi:hypothetical protein